MTQNLPVMQIRDFSGNKTALVIIDMINGFLTEGTLASERCAGILPAVEKLLNLAKENKIPCIAFADAHESDCPEFASFPLHCLKNTSESELAPSLKKIGGFQTIKKNSTNGFFAPDFQKFLKQHPDLENVILCGVCTDICVMQFALTLKSFYNQNQKNLHIYIPVNAVETYDAPGHNADQMQMAALQILAQAGIILISEVKDDEK